MRDAFNWVLDMDDTLVHFNQAKDALKKFSTEKDFFTNLEPTPLTNYINRHLQQRTLTPNQMYIVSASPNLQADKDKLKWIKRHLPDISESNILFTRLGENKAEQFKSRYNLSDKDLQSYILFDDYTKNLTEWKSQGGLAIKIINEYNNTKQSYKHYNINTLDFTLLW